jgi:cytochrome c556
MGGTMSCRRIALITILSTFAGVIATAQPAVAETRVIKQVMAENFDGLQRILLSLIAADYAGVPELAGAIHEHAEEIMQMVPKDARDERVQFLTYAYNLQKHADDIKSISETLIELQQKGEAKVPGAIQLQEAIAAHYGGVVTMCVACHNRFRPRIGK